MSDLTHTPSSFATSGAHNTALRFGSVAKAFHWMTALLILTMIPSGVIAHYWPYDTSAQLATKATLFSLHKTLGIVTFAVALARILWAVTQPRPALLPTGSKLQHLAAEAVHWSLYAALVLVPLSGWVHHAATTGFAPIWWPFGQTLPFVPQSELVASVTSGLHLIFVIMLVTSLALHVGGALKHHLVDRDATLKRMLPGTCDLPAELQAPQTHRAPLVVTIIAWALAVAAGVGVGLSKDTNSVRAATLATVPSQWVVQDGTLSITVDQLGQPITGSFADWTAAINFSETARDGTHGDVSVTVSVPSLTLGSVTSQALGAEFLRADSFATATFSGPITADGDGYVVNGTLQMIGNETPLRLPFDLALDGDTATARGTAPLDRRALGIGETYPDEDTVGFTVEISFDLIAVNGAAE